MGTNREFKATLFSELFSDSHHLRESLLESGHSLDEIKMILKTPVGN